MNRQGSGRPGIAKTPCRTQPEAGCSIRHGPRDATRVIQACRAFQTITGTVQSRAMTSIDQNPAPEQFPPVAPGRAEDDEDREQLHRVRVFREEPDADEQPRERPPPCEGGLFSSASQKVYTEAAQKKIERGSMVMTTAPTLKIGIAFSSSTVQIATRSL